MPKKLILSIVVLSLASFCLDTECTNKTIFSSKSIINPNYQTKDRTLAYNKVASCATLTPSKDTNLCCYIKVKFENTLNEEKYTHKGCVEVPIWYLSDNDTYDIDNFIDAMEADINSNNTYTNSNYKLETKSISIDCASKYLQLVGLAFLLLLL